MPLPNRLIKEYFIHWRYRIVSALDDSRDEQTGHIRVQRNGLANLRAVALLILSCLAACPGVIPASMSFVLSCKWPCDS